MLQKTSLSWIETNFARFCGGLLKFYSPALSWTKPNKPTIRWLLERCRLPIVPWPYEAMHDLLDLTSEFPWWKLDGFFSPLPGPQARGVREGLYGLGLGARNHKNEQIKYYFTGIVADIPPIGWPPFFSFHLFSNGKRHKEAFFCHLFLKWKEKKRFSGRDKLLHQFPRCSKLSVKHKPRKLRSNMRLGSNFVYCSPGVRNLFF